MRYTNRRILYFYFTSYFPALEVVTTMRYTNRRILYFYFTSYFPSEITLAQEIIHIMGFMAVI